VPETPINYPKSEEHVNIEIRDFLSHFSSSRKIKVAPKSAKDAYMRSEDEKTTILSTFSEAQTAESE